MLRYFDWQLLVLVVGITLFGIVCIFSATSSEVTDTPSSVMDMLETQSTYYPRLQFQRFLLSLLIMAIFIYPPYWLYARWSTGIYILNIVVLAGTLGLAQVGRGGMQAFVSVGSDTSFQPSEFGKVAMIICFAQVFSRRKKPIRKLRDLMVMFLYMFIPLVLIFAQPDVGTALVYVVVFAVMLLISGTDSKLLLRIVFVGILVLIPVWYYLKNASTGDDFRLKRILIWLDPEAWPDDARQVINAQIAVGSGGLFGKGIVSPGSFASLGYISDDHTDFIFAIVCESFGLVGGVSLVLGYAVLIGHLIYVGLRVEDAYGSYLIFGVMGMLLAHIIENLCMVLGLLPVTGIPLPFVSYGGSNLITNMACIGIVENVVMRSKFKRQNVQIHRQRALEL